MRTFIHGYLKDSGGAATVVIVLTAVHEQAVYMLISYQSSAAASAMYNLLLLAYETGLGTCWMAGQLWIENEILDFLDTLRGVFSD